MDLSADGQRVLLSNGVERGGEIYTLGATPGTGAITSTIPQGGAPGANVEGFSNNANKVVGTNPARTRAAFWDTTARVWTDLALASNTDVNIWPPVAVDANADGSSVIGWFYVRDPVTGKATLRTGVWNTATPTAKPTLFSLFSSSVPDTPNGTLARAISADGTVAAGYYMSGTTYAVMWHRTGTAAPYTWPAKKLTKLPSTTTRIEGEAKNVSKDGHWIVGGGPYGLFMYTEGFSTTVGGVTTVTPASYTALGSCDSARTETAGTGAYISDDGSTVAGTLCMQTDCTGCVWTKSGGMKTLKNYLTAKGVSIGTRPATNVFGMSANGKAIAAGGGGPGSSSSWVAVTP
jgi:hypothetical protein